MIFGYLSQFWDAIADATADTVAWFESVGNAVAGALGSVLVFMLQPLFDVFLSLIYFVSNIVDVFEIIANRIFYFFYIVYSFLSQFTITNIQSAASDISSSGFLYSFSSINTVLYSIPYFSVLVQAVGWALLALTIFWIIEIIFNQ